MAAVSHNNLCPATRSGTVAGSRPLHSCKPHVGQRCFMSAFMLYAVGFVVMLAGLIYGAMLLNVPQNWIIVGGLVVLGLGVMTGVSLNKQPDPPADH